MAQVMVFPSRPPRTDDLIERLKSPDYDGKEKKVLRAICQNMIAAFKDNPRSIYVSEATALSSIAKENHESLTELVRAFANAIIKGTADGNIKDPQLLGAFAHVLWHIRDASSVRSSLGTVLDSLLARLKKARQQAELDSQYHLVLCLSAVLDAMVETRFSGIGRESLHQPLQKELKDLRGHEELRLAQAAAYAYQALLGVSDNEGPYQALWRSVREGITMAANVTGAVLAKDPARLLESLPDPNSILDSIQKFFERAENAVEVAKDPYAAGHRIEIMKNLSRQKGWYTTLRYTDMLLQSKALKMLKLFIQQVPHHNHEYFLCGLYAQLEMTWEVARKAKDEDTQNQMVDIFRQTLPLCTKSPPIAQEWAKLTAHTFQLPQLTSNLPTSRRHLLHRKKYVSGLKILLRESAQPGSPANDLLEKGWSKCSEARAFYADTGIRRHYTQGNRLQIVRLSGEVLPIESCYINLALVKQLDNNDRRNESSSFSLAARLKVEVSQKDEQVALSEIFASRKGLDGKDLTPRRILIRGRAGVGKTTLCKKIVYEYIHGRLWTKLFDRLLWIPLRRLKGKFGVYNLKMLLNDEYFTQNAEDADLAEALWSEPTFRERTLFLLDGLDEVSHDWDPEDNMGRFIKELLGQPNVILTSRPQGLISGEKHDLELDTVGFLQSQVDAYLNKCVGAVETVKDIQTFLTDKPLIQGLVRIPIQLDALCFSWAALELTKDKPKTMTMLYQDIARELWKKDILRLNKRDDGIQLSEKKMQSLTAVGIEEFVRCEMQLLEGFAFLGLLNGIIEFTHKQRTAICENLKRHGVKIPALHEETFRKLSFLRASSTEQKEMDRTYHFLHLTFQEYFAARFFTRHYLSGNKIFFWKFDSTRRTLRNNETRWPKEFLLIEKYNPRYDIFWRFVTGLMQAESDQESQNNRLLDYLDTLQTQSNDLFGPVHHRLLMHCLSETTPSEQHSIRSFREQVEDNLKQWALSECKTNQNMGLMKEREFPEDLLKALLVDPSRDAQMATLSALKLRPNVKVDTLRQVSRWLKDHVSMDLRMRSFELLLEYWTRLPKDILHCLASSLIVLLKDTDSYVRGSAARALYRQSTLSQEALTALVALSKDTDSYVRRSVADILGRQSTLP